MADGFISVDVRNVPALIFELRQEMANILREQADAEANPAVARRLREVKTPSRGFPKVVRYLPARSRTCPRLRSYGLGLTATQRITLAQTVGYPGREA